MALAFGLALNCGGSATSSDPGSLGLMLGLAGQQQTASGQADIVLRLNLPQTAASAAAGPVSRSGALATQVSDVTRVSIEITGTGIAAPITAGLTQNGSVWTGTIPGIPVGTDRSFVARAYNLADELLYEGQSTNVTIAFNQTAQLQIQMQESNPAAAFSNVAPYLQTFAMSGGEVRPGETISFSVTAIDDNAGDVLSFAWTADGGSFDDATSATPIWTAPASNGNYTITVNVSDPLGAQATMSVSALVDDGTGSGSVGIGFNNTPAVTSVTAMPTRIDVNASTNISAIVTDADGDVLTYAWTSDCGGSFADATALSTTFTAPATYPASNQCTLTISVDDSNGGVNSGSLTINVRAPVTIDPIVVPDTQAPTLTGLSVSPANVDTTNGPVSVTLTITISDNQAFSALPYTGDFNIVFSSPFVPGQTQHQFIFGAGSASAQPGSTATQRTYVLTRELPQYSGGGNWEVSSLFMTDAAGNNATLTGSQLASQGFSASFNNAATNGDFVKPVLSAFSLSSSTINTESTDVTLNVDASITDNRQLPGPYFWNITLSLTSNSGAQLRYAAARTSQMLPGGTNTARSFSMPVQFPRYSEAGVWTITRVEFGDALGNVAVLDAAGLTALGFPSVVTNNATVQDITPPTLAALTIATPTISNFNVVSPNGNFGVIEMSINLTDDFGMQTASQLANGYITLSNPSGSVGAQGFISIDPTGTDGGGGTPTDYTFIAKAYISETAEKGDWVITSLSSTDLVGNRLVLTTADLTAAGFPTVVTVQ